MITKDEILASISTQESASLLEKLANKKTRDQIVALDRNLRNSHEPCEILNTIIDQIPSSEWAKRDDCEAIVFDLISENPHHGVLSSITGRLIGMSLAEHEAQATLSKDSWIRQFALDRKIKEIHNSEKILDPLMKYVAYAHGYDQMKKFVGQAVESITMQSIRDSIDKMGAEELVKALGDKDRFRALSSMGNGDYGALVAHAINAVPLEAWPQAKKLAETFEQLLETRSPRVLEALVGVIEKLPEETLLSQVDDKHRFGNYLTEWAFTDNVKSVASGTFQEYLPVVNRGSNPISDLIGKRTSIAQATRDAGELFATPKASSDLTPGL